MEAPQRLHAKKTMIKLSEPLILTLAVATALAATSCGTVFEELEPCRTGVEMRFVYDCNLESANAFPTQVECLTLHIFDSDGGFVTTVTETSSVLSDENWRLTLDLEPGSYHAIAYGGIACGDDSFAHDAVPAEGSDYHDIAMRLKQDHIGRLLADHFHGSLDFEVDDNPAVNDYSRVTLSMRKTTNRFRILLQPLDGIKALSPRLKPVAPELLSPMSLSDSANSAHRACTHRIIRALSSAAMFPAVISWNSRSTAISCSLKPVIRRGAIRNTSIDAAAGILRFSLTETICGKKHI